MKKRAVSMMLAAVCALSLCACGSKSAEPAAQAEPAAEAPAETEAAEEESVSGTEEAPV